MESALCRNTHKHSAVAVSLPVAAEVGEPVNDLQEAHRERSESAGADPHAGRCERGSAKRPPPIPILIR